MDHPSPACTVRSLLHEGRQAGLPRLEAQLLLGHVLSQSRTWLLAHDEDAVPEAAVSRYRDLVARRQDQVPIGYLLGRHEFHGLALEVGPGVLDPRPDTETLVDWALETLCDRSTALPAPRCVDLGTGSGAIALALKAAHPAADVVATDVSPEALTIARRNAERLALTVAFTESDWWRGLSGRQFDLIVSNPPYIAADDPHLAALRHEPIGALTPGGDGLDALRRIVEGSNAHLVSGGWLLLEHGHDQARAVRGMLQEAGYLDVATRTDLAGIDRCTGGRRPPAP